MQENTQNEIEQGDVGFCIMRMILTYQVKRKYYEEKHWVLLDAIKEIGIDKQNFEYTEYVSMSHHQTT
jgi:hypothetical protein